jgi:hypothetical protein
MPIVSMLWSIFAKTSFTKAQTHSRKRKLSPERADDLCKRYKSDNVPLVSGVNITLPHAFSRWLLMQGGSMLILQHMIKCTRLLPHR